MDQEAGAGTEALPESGLPVDEVGQSEKKTGGEEISEMNHTNHKNRESVFQLTPLEARLLPLIRAGKSQREIAESSGKSLGTVKMASAVTSEKERIQGLRDYRPGVATSLWAARGRALFQSDPRRGAWKNPR